MGCCKCSCTKKLEHVDQVIHDYDPQENFLNYKVTTIWINRKTKRAWLLVSKEGGIAVWQPIPLEQSTIDKIILDCGEVEPNEKGEIIHTGECGARTVTDDCKDLCITLRTDWGLQGGGTVCAGESLTLGIDLANTTLVISSVKDVQDGDLVAFNGTSGKVIKKADNLRLGDAENSWNGKINPTTKALEFYPNDLSTTPIFSMLPNGVMLMPWQPKVGALFSTTAKLGQANVDLQIGSFAGAKFTTVLDQDGYNLSAGNFFPGDGTSQGAYYITNYDNAFYLVIAQFLANKPSPDPHVSANFRINYEGMDPYIYRKQMPATVSFETFLCITVIKSVKGKKITFSVASTYDQLEISQFSNTRENYVGIYMLG